MKFGKYRIKKKSHKILIIVALILFIIWNIIWLIGSASQYLRWELQMMSEEGYNGGVVEDDEQYCYSVAVPGYLSWNSGNLAIGESLDKLSDMGDGRALYVSRSSLIIWLKHFYKGVREIGVILEQDGVSRQIYLVDNETARYPDDQPYVDGGRDAIDKLFRKAEKEWDLVMPWKE